MDFNKVILIGRLTADVELRYTQDGTPVASFTIGINKKFTDSAGNKKESVCFVPIVVWKKQGENCAEYLKKGSPCLVEGELKQSSWNDKESGKKRSKLEVVAYNVRFLGGKKDDTAKTPEASPAPEIPPDAEQGNEFPLDENGEAMPNF